MDIPDKFYASCNDINPILNLNKIKKQTKYSRKSEVPINSKDMKDFPNSNRTSYPNSNIPFESIARLDNFIDATPRYHPILNKSLMQLPTVTLSNSDLLNDTSQEMEMPSLTRELDVDQRTSFLTDYSNLNKRYQNVCQFPNYRHRKKAAFERKLKRCGLELDGEVTISILRQFLQPFIYRDINSILNEYIKKYFIKAFNNIRENINITSENWSQILKCSISKSLYRQYCTEATIDPFDPISTDLTDFPCFPIVCKAQNLPNQKSSSTPADVLVKSDLDESTIQDAVSDTNSDFSNSSENCGKSQIDIIQSTNVCNLVYSNQKSCSNNDTNGNLNMKPSNPFLLKRKLETNHLQDDYTKQSLLVSANYECSSPKRPKLKSSTQSTRHNRVHNLSGHSQHIQSHNHFNQHTENHNDYHPHRKLQNISQTYSDQIQPKTAPFDNKNISFFSNTPVLSKLEKSNRNNSIGGMQPQSYLKPLHQPIENGNSNNIYFQST